MICEKYIFPDFFLSNEGGMYAIDFFEEYGL